MCFFCTLCWVKMGAKEAFGIWVDSADNAQAEIPGSVEEAASQPDPWLGDGHGKWPGDRLWSQSGTGWQASGNSGQGQAHIIEEQTPIPKYPQESAHEPCRRERVISTQDAHFNLTRRYGKPGSSCCPSEGYEDFNFLVNSVIVHLLSTTFNHL